MKQVRIDSLLEIPEDRVSLQKEWSMHSAHPFKALLLEIALYAGLVGPGLYIVSFFIGFNYGFFLSLLIVFIGYALPHLFFLGRIPRFYLAVLKPGSSWISRGFIIANFFLLFAFLASAPRIPVVKDYFIVTNVTIVQFILWAGLIFAILLSIYPGFLFSVLKSIPFWNTFLTVPIFLVQTISSGFALMFVLLSFFVVDNSIVDKMIIANLISITITCLMYILFIMGRLKAERASQESMRYLLSGKYKILFDLGGLLMSTVLPGVFLILYFSYKAVVFIPVAGVLQLLGIFFFKYSYLNAGAYRQLTSVEEIYGKSK